MEGQVAIGDFVYQAQAPGGVINQIVVAEPIRALPRPVDARPRSRRDLVARTSIVGEITEAVSREPVQVVAGDGWGKTSVVAQLAYHRDIERYPDGIVVISAWGLPVEDVEQAIFDAFFESTLPDTVHKITSGQLRTSFATVEAAILIDDLDLPRQHVDRLIDACGRSGFVSTASTQTMWSGGSVFDLERMDDTDALALFQQRVGRVVESVELEAVKAFITRVRGYPMAVVAAAAAARRGVALLEVLPRLHQAADPVAAVHEEIAATFSLAESRILAVLAAVQGDPLPPDAVGRAAAVDDAEALLEGLKRDGIVQAASPRYRLPSSSSALLDLRVDGPATAQGLAAWCAGGADAGAIAAAGPAIASAMRLATRANDYASAMALGRSADGALALSGRWGVWGQMLEAAKEASVAAKDPFVESWTLHQLGTRALAEQRDDAALAMLTQAADIRRQIGDAAGLEVTEHNLSILAPPPPIVPPQTPSPPTPRPPAPTGSGIPWWAWTMIVAGLLAVAGIVGYVVANRPPDSPVVTTAAVLNGELEATRGMIEIFDVPSGASASSEVGLVNTGSGPVEVTNVVVDGPGSLSAETDCGLVEAGESCGVQVMFSPRDPGEFDGVLIVEHSGINGRIEIPIIATAIDPPEAIVSPDPVNLDFGTVEGATALAIETNGLLVRSSRTLEVRNSASLEVRIGDIRLTTERFVAADDCTSLAPGESCFVEVGLLADQPGTFTDMLTIEHSAQNRTIEIPISGTVLAPPNLTIEIAAVAPFTPVTVIDPTIDAGALERIDTFILVDPTANVDPLILSEAFVGFESPVLVDPAIVADPNAAKLHMWTVEVVADISNTGETAIPPGFRFRFETKTSDTPGPWNIAMSADGAPAVFSVDQTLGPGHTISIPVLLGFSADVYEFRTDQPKGRPFAQLRVEVDSCSLEDPEATPPCMVDEADESDNLSTDTDVPFIVMKKVID